MAGARLQGPRWQAPTDSQARLGPELGSGRHELDVVHVRYPYPGGGRPHGIHYADPAASSGRPVAIASRSARVSRTRIARVAICCGAESVVECRGRLRLGRRGSTLGRGSFVISAGRRATVRVKLGRRAFRSLARVGRLRGRAVASARDRLGNKKRASRRITLRGPG